MSITVYSTPTCPICHKVKEYFKEKGVAFTDVDVANDPNKQKEMVEKSGKMSVPVIDINGTIISGFDQAKIDEALGK